MPQPRRILPSDSLESGFRVAHNETADAIADFSRCQITDAGALQFYNDQAVFLGEINLATVFRRLTDVVPGAAAPQFYSASTAAEGTGKIATTQQVEAGDEQYNWITPALLRYAFNLLKDELLTSAAPPPTPGTDASEGPVAINKVGDVRSSVQIPWRKAAEYVFNTGIEGLSVLADRLLYYISLRKLTALNGQFASNLEQFDGNYIQYVRPGESAYRGILWGELDADGNLIGYPESVQRYPDGTIHMTQSGFDDAFILSRATAYFGRNVESKGTVKATRYSATAMPVAQTTPKNLLVTVDGPNGQQDIVSIPYAPFKAVLDAQAVTFGRIDRVYCRQVELPAPTETRWRELTPAMLNTDIVHPLDVPGPQIIVSLRDSAGKADTALSWSFGGSDTIRFALPSGLSGYEGGSYKLETRLPA